MKAASDQQLDDLQDVVHRFRRTPLTADALPSTGHAVVRALLAARSPERRRRLLDVLDDRMNYGVFLDVHTANMCMDAFIKEGNYRGEEVVGDGRRWASVMPGELPYSDVGGELGLQHFRRVEVMDQTVQIQCKYSNRFICLAAAVDNVL